MDEESIGMIQQQLMKEHKIVVKISFYTKGVGGKTDLINE